MKAKALIVPEFGKMAVDETEVPAPGPGEVLLETLFSVVSPGTELRVFGGRQPGDIRPPFIPGYSLAGQVLDRGPGVSLPEGTLCFATGTQAASHHLTWGGHASLAVVAKNAVVPVPEGVDALSATFAHVAGIAWRGVSVSGIAARFNRGCDLTQTSVAVVGLGTIGQLSTRCFKATGANVVAGDRSRFRVGVAQKVGVNAIVVENQLDEAFGPHLPQGADIVVDSTGVESVLERAFALTREKPWGVDGAPAGKVVVQGSYPGDVRFDYHAAFFKEMTLLFPRDAEPGDMRQVLELMADGRLEVADLATEVVVPEESPRVFSDFVQGRPDLLTVAFRWK